MKAYRGSWMSNLSKLATIFIIGIGLLPLTSCDNIPKAEKDIYKAIEKKNFVKAQKRLEKMWDMVDTWPRIPSTVRQYWTAYFDLLNAEINYLIDDRDDNVVSVDRLVGLIQNQRTGTLPPFVGVTSDSKVIKANEVYNEVASRINSSLDGAIQRAIAKRDRYLATSILKCYKPLLIKDYAGGGLFEASSYSFSYSYDAQYAAEAIVNAAIKKGQL